MTEVVNHTTGEKCELDFRARGWTSRNNNTIFGVVKDAKGVPKFHLTGKYTESIEVINLDTNETFVAWTAPEKAANADMMYGFNPFTLQLNLLTESLQ
jgi:oxysterol-binding protein 1